MWNRSWRRAGMAGAVVLSLAAAAAPAQQPAGAEYYGLLVRARAALDARRFSEAADLYRRAADANPRDGEVWLAYVMAAQAAGRLPEALDAAERVAALGAGYRLNASIKPVNLGLADRSRLAFTIARGHAGLGRRDRALAWLGRALEWGFTPRTAMQADSAFAPLRDDPAFRRLAGFPPAGVEGREARWRHDIDFLVEEARRLHASFAREAHSAEFAAAAESLKAAVASLPDRQIVVGMQRLVVLLRDGHSVVAPPAGGRALPVDFYWFSDGLFVVNGVEGGRRWIGSRVLRFGTRAVDSVLADLPAYVSRDNPMGVRWIGPTLLANLDYLQALGGTSDPDRAALTLRDRDGAVREVVLEGVALRPRPKLVPPFGDTARAPLFLKQVGTPYWFTPLPGAAAIYFQFNQVANQPRGEPLADFAPRLRDAVRDPAVRNLIVDVRHNNGGNSYLYPPLLRVFSYFEESDPGRRIFYLAGRNTFSAAQNFSTNVERLTRAVFVGEPTGSSPRFTGEGAIWFELPFSRTRASISNWYHQFTFWSDTRLWIAPDVPVDLSSADYFAGRDPALEAVLQIIRDHPPGGG